MLGPTIRTQFQNHRRVRWLAAVVILGVGAWLAVDAYVQQRRVAWLVSEVRAVHAHVSLPPTPVQQLLHGSWPWHGGGVHFAMGWGIEPGWLREHDCLRGLGIQRLALVERPTSRAEFTKLLQMHPIQELSAREYAGEIAGLLKECPKLQRVDFEQSDLSDSGFCELPFEQLSSINIAGASVSHEGLQQLSRCRSLTLLAIDSKQIDAAVTVLVESRIPIETLEIRDSSAEDRHLRKLQDLPLRRLELRRGSVSVDAVELLKQHLPDCSIIVN